MLDSPDFSILFCFLAFIFGIFTWSLGEYLLHRYCFHFENSVTDNKYIIWLHFIIHGIHHTIPMDPDRLVFPPILGVISFFILFLLYSLIFPGSLGRLVFAGFVLGYIGYDTTHYYIHHGTPWIDHFKEMKSYHNKHHYVDGNRGYGITSKFWDKVFGTELV